MEQVQEVLFVRQDERGLVGGRGRYWKLEELGTYGEKCSRRNLFSILAFPSPPVMYVLRLTVLCLFVYLFIFCFSFPVGVFRRSASPVLSLSTLGDRGFLASTGELKQLQIGECRWTQSRPFVFRVPSDAINLIAPRAHEVAEVSSGRGWGWGWCGKSCRTYCTEFRILSFGWVGSLCVLGQGSASFHPGL